MRWDNRCNGRQWPEEATFRLWASPFGELPRIRGQDVNPLAELHLVVTSLAPFAVPGALRVIGRAFDVDEAFRPSRLDVRDPPLKGVGLVEPALAELERDLCDPEEDDPYVHVVLERDTLPELSAAIETGDRDAAEAAGWDDRRAPHLTPGGLSIAFGREDDFRDSPDLLERLCALLVRLCEATDAYTGTVSFEAVLERQLRAFLLAARSPARQAPLPPGANIWERELRRPGWLTFLGPGYVEHFGRDRLATLGTGRVWTAAGGVVVRSTGSPFVFDPSARSTADYPFIRQWLDVLGRDVFAHEHQVPGAPGRHVPLMAAHVAHARPPGADPFARAGDWTTTAPQSLAPGPTRPARRVPPVSAWTIRTVAALRSLGFFTGWDGDDAMVAARLEEDRRRSTGAGFEPGEGVWSELELAAGDHARVWWADTEADVQAGAKVYERVIRQWAAISRGIFLPARARERWESDEGPVDVAVDLDGQEHELRVSWLGDFIDVDGLLEQVNDILVDRARRFVPVTTGDQTAYVIMVDRREQKVLLDRGWPLPAPGGGSGGQGTSRKP